MTPLVITRQENGTNGQVSASSRSPEVGLCLLFFAYFFTHKDKFLATTSIKLVCPHFTNHYLAQCHSGEMYLRLVVFLKNTS